MMYSFTSTKDAQEWDVIKQVRTVLFLNYYKALGINASGYQHFLKNAVSFTVIYVLIFMYIC